MYLRFILQAFFLFLCLVCSVKNYHAEQAEARLSYSHIVKVSSLLPATVCNWNSTRVPSKASVEVVSRYGPCSYINKGKGKTPNYKEILRKDRARAKYIQSRIFKHKHSGSDDDLLKQTDAFTVGTKPELSDGVSVGFYITVSLGTPGQNVSLLLDTGSDITWTQCKPCQQCFKQKTPLFDPSKSSTYSAVPCQSSACLPDFGRFCDEKTCVYSAFYGSGSSIGVVATEKLTIMNGRSDTFIKNPYIFGCGINNSADFDGVTGLMGLDRNPSSFISQTSQKYFSYCYPSSYGSTGYITFGKTDDEKKYKFVKFTPIPTSPKQSQFYDIIVTGMAIAGSKLPVASSEYTKPGAIIDSGTTFTSLPPSVYVALRSAFRKKMSKYKMIKPGSNDEFDICYDFRKYDKVVIPKISIFFKGGVKLELDVKGTMVVLKRDLSQVCLAFDTSSEFDDTSLILGNCQLRGIEVHHDFVGQRVGFGPGGCS
ncbi:aspartyl protease family protein At5g10770-like [Mangifera indica]|uniref:aspartyl protease family protein At5g10770-like n=1 Tax=Mangifera indica TaxID=29780 RepID=UPI001CF955AC|nr:aspartyl protease family protein At5g10770-like [Mangifera indica]